MSDASDFAMIIGVEVKPREALHSRGLACVEYAVECGLISGAPNLVEKEIS